MISKVYTASTTGLQVNKIEIELDTSPGLPSIVVVGLPDKAVQESKERLKSSLKQSGFEFPEGKLTINLAPADVAKSGTAYDLPMAIGVLEMMNYINKIPEDALFLGELSLDGVLRPITGVLTIALKALDLGIKSIFVPSHNALEARLAKGVEVFAVNDLKQLVDHLNHKKEISPTENIKIDEYSLTLESQLEELEDFDLAYVKGQEQAKRALEIAASGGHNTMFIGPPGSGKTLLARSYASILPKMSDQEILEVTQLYSIAGLLPGEGVMYRRPFRSPHHSASHIALVGGGSRIRPGEISLAHRGVLFLDEFPEFDRKTIEALRQPLEDGVVSISRASGTLTFPSRFYLLAAANPTPAGFDPDDKDSLQRPQSKKAILSYQSRFSGPIMDRIDLQVEVTRVEHDKLQDQELGETSAFVRLRVQRARDIQTARFKDTKITCNAEMTLPMILKYCGLSEESKKMLKTASEKYKLSARAYMRLLKLSRTIADLAGEDEIKLEHVAESLQYRGKF
jgi:magnesium chelatase family protein